VSDATLLGREPGGECVDEQGCGQYGGDGDRVENIDDQCEVESAFDDIALRVGMPAER
jgi:hypothetical protein